MNIQKRGAAWRLINVAMLLSLVLALLPGTALALPAAQAQELAPSQATASPGTGAAPEGATASTPVEGPVTCADSTRPASAQRFSLLRDDEVGVMWKGASGKQMWEYDYYGTSGLTYAGSTGYAIDNEWARSTAVDFNGDGYDEIFTAYRGANDELSAVSTIWHPGIVNWRDYWTATTGRLTGGNVKYVDVAAGNFGRRTDGRQWVVIATKNDDSDLEMLMLNGSDDGGISQGPGYVVSSGQYHNMDYGRGTVWHVAVASGDLNGDGFDDEIVTAFKDGDNHLQILVTRRESTGWNTIAYYRYDTAGTAHYADNVCKNGDSSESPERGIDVTTGDIDGDMKEEAIVAFVDNGNQFQVISLGLTAGSSLAEEGYYRAEEDTKDPDYVSVAAPDLNGDGFAEITAAFGPRNDAPAQVWVLSYGAPPSGEDGRSLKRDQVYKDQASYDAGEYKRAKYVTIEAGNVDRNGRQEAILAFMAGKDGNDAIAERVLYEPSGGSLQQKAKRNMDSGAGTAYDVSVIVGDIDKDSSVLTYAGVCKQYGVASLNTVVNLPPSWYDYNLSGSNGIGATFGVEAAGGGSESKTLTFNYGGSYTIDGSVSFLDIFEAGPSMTVAFEGSYAVSQEETVDAATEVARTGTFGGDDSAYGFVIDDQVTIRTYKYIESSTGKEIWVRVPSRNNGEGPVMERWNSMRNYRGWLPLGTGPRINLALGRAATQSSTYSSAAASRAVDGNTDGVYSNNSVSHTNSEANPWWQVDLGSSQPIETIDVYNRVDCCQDRLRNWVIKVSDTNTTAGWASPKWSQTFTGVGGSPTVATVGVSGRYVRVQILGTNYLHLAEVQVWKDTRTNLALGKTARQSSNAYASGGTANLAVDGNTDGNYANGSVTHSNNTPAPIWWDVDLGSLQPVGEVDVWNRTDSGVDRLKNYYVKVYDTDPATGASPIWTSYKQQNVAGRPTGVPVGVKGRWVRIELEAADYLTLAEVQVWKGREVSDFPKAITRNSDNYFTITQQNGTTQMVPGNLKWDWCGGYKDESAKSAGTYIKDLVKAQDPVYLFGGNTETTWKMSKATGGSSGWSDSYGISASWGAEAKVLGVGAEWSVSAGFDQGRSSTVTWNNGTYFEGSAGKFASGASNQYRYQYCPYYYTTKSTSPDGFDQTYLVLDYYVPCIGDGAVGGPTACPAVAAAAQAASAPASSLAVQPGTPVIASATHPDPNAWSPDNTATFAWQQPAGDPSTGLAYRWYLDQQPDTVPEAPAQGTDQTYTYYNLADGTWYLHVRAVGTGDQWSDTAHRQIRIDRLAPEVKLDLDPPYPNGNQDWYTGPVTVTASATDAGSGLAALEISTDGVSWQPYAGPLHYTTDTPATTVWARASDVAGHVSEPVSTTLKLDLTPPDSHASGTGCLLGVCRAEVVTDAQGNEHLILAGQIHENTSGNAGMEIQANGGSWTSAGALGEWHPFSERPDVAVNWVYTGTLDIGHGYHIFQGRASDGAGNLEAPYKIAELIWYPLASPDLSQSTITMEPAVARPGDVVTVTLAVRNGGRQEAHVAISATLPAGLRAITDTLKSLDDSTTYDQANGIVTWPDVLLWPGDSRHIQFQAQVAAGLPAGNLTVKLDAHGFWPNTDLLPTADMRQRFLDHEATVTASGNLSVDPLLPSDRDVIAPHVRLAIGSGELTSEATVALALQADTDVTRMYLREWSLDPVSGVWLVAHDSGWLPYAPSLTWTLSDKAGVKYIGAWVADAAGNISRLDEASLAFTNRLIDDELLAGQRRQYRFSLDDGLAVFNLMAYSGQAELYGWMPKLGQYPTYVGIGNATLKALGFQITQEGVHLVEAMADQDTSYRLLSAYGPVAAAAGGSASAAALPNYPLTLSTPLTGGVGIVPQLEIRLIYLPSIFR